MTWDPGRSDHRPGGALARCRGAQEILRAPPRHPARVAIRDGSGRVVPARGSRYMTTKAYIGRSQLWKTSGDGERERQPGGGRHGEVIRHAEVAQREDDGDE